MFILTKITPLPPALNNLFKYLILFSVFTLPAQAKIIQRKMHMVCQEHESAYWDGAKGVCCDGSVYQPDIEDTSYACCPTGKEVSIVQGKENLNHCCSEGQKAYWNGSSAQCCATATHQIVTNYISGQTDTAYACFDIESIKEEEQNDPRFLGNCYLEYPSLSHFHIAGAVDGVFCGGYTLATYTLNEKFIEDWPEIDCGNGGRTTSYSYDIYQNGGVYYCANTYNDKNRKSSFESPSQNCTYEYYEGEWLLNFCLCSDKGDPRNNGEPCDP